MSSSIFSSFSNPYEGGFVTLAENLSCRVFRNLLLKSQGIANRLKVAEVPLKPEEITPQRVSTKSWMPQMGALGLALHKDLNESSWSWLNGSFMLAAYLSGVRTSIDVEISGFHPLTMMGNLLEGERFHLHGGHDKLLVDNLRDETLLVLRNVEREGSEPVWIEEKKWVQQSVVRAGSAIQIPVTSDSWMRYWMPDFETGLPANNPQAFRETLSTVFSLLEEHSPLHFIWIVSLLREVVFWQELSGGTRSQSFQYWPGHVQVSEASPLDAIVELLHECSHQYFNLLLWLANPVKANAPKGYSVLKDCERPLDRILLGFHAFGNVLLALPALENSESFEQPEIDRQMRNVTRLVSELDLPLQRHCSEYLEDVGKEIYLPLRDRLVASHLLKPS